MQETEKIALGEEAKGLYRTRGREDDVINVSLLIATSSKATSGATERNITSQSNCTSKWTVNLYKIVKEWHPNRFLNFWLTSPLMWTSFSNKKCCLPWNEMQISRKTRTFKSSILWSICTKWMFCSQFYYSLFVHSWPVYCYSLFRNMSYVSTLFCGCSCANKRHFVEFVVKRFILKISL